MLSIYFPNHSSIIPKKQRIIVLYRNGVYYHFESCVSASRWLPKIRHMNTSYRTIYKRLTYRIRKKREYIDGFAIRQVKTIHPRRDYTKRQQRKCQRLNSLLRISDQAEWKDVPDYDGEYQVNTAGQVRRAPHYLLRADNRIAYHKPYILTDHRKYSYRSIVLHYHDKPVDTTPSYLMARTFLHADRNQHVQVFHKDGDPTNNHLNNLILGDRRTWAKHIALRRIYIKLYKNNHYVNKFRTEQSLAKWLQNNLYLNRSLRDLSKMISRAVHNQTPLFGYDMIKRY